MWGLGWASLLNDVASELVVPVLPAFVASLGGGGFALGAIDGVSELVAAALKGWSGRASDRAGVSWPFVLGGYGVAAIARPLLVFAAAPWHVVAIRVADRVGKGLRTAPRDALLAASVPADQRGAAFGFHRRMDHTGAMIGPLLALPILAFVTTDPRWIFALTLVPGALAVAAVARVPESPRPPTDPVAARWDPSMLRAAGPFALAAASQVTDLFLVARVTQLPGAPAIAGPLVWVALHLVRQEVAGRAGGVADQLPAARVVATGWTLRALGAVAMAAAASPGWAALAVVAYGLGAASEGAEKKLVAARWASHGQGSAFGAYHLTAGLAAMAGALAFGALWDVAAPAVALGAAAAGTVAAALWVTRS